MLTKKEFAVLSALAGDGTATQREIAQSEGLSLGSVNAARKKLADDGLVDDDGITAAGLAALEPYRVENAVIMAAGLSSRFVPISYEKPKGLLRVRGEILIERQIEQLIAAGVTDITVVVGYKGEYFLYLEDKYGVSVVFNRQYASRNNNSSIKAVADRLGNTYICSSDNYFAENPFTPYAWKAFYSAVFSEGRTEEWCMHIGAHDRIESVAIGGEGAWYMIGHVYFDRAFSKRFVEILEAEYDLPETAGKLWEDIFLAHVDELEMVIKRFGPGIIHEFDSLDELRAFDPLFLENLDSEVFDNIVRVLGCSKSEIHDVYPLKQGLTNLSCHFSTADGEFVYRHPGVGTENLVDRAAEEAALRVAKELGIDDTFIYEDPARGWKISRFIPNCRELDPHDPTQAARAMSIAAKLHATDVAVERRFDFYEEGKRYESILLEKGSIDVPGYWEMSEKAERLRAFAAADGAPTCLTHNDFFYLNFLIDENDKFYLIDWEYAGMSDYASDFGTFTVCCELSEDEARMALDAYFGRPATFEEVRHCFAFVALAGWCWYAWSLVKEAEGDFVGEWLYIYYRYAKNYMDKVLSWYENGNADERNGEEN